MPSSAVKAADLVEVLSGKGPFTVFAPTDKAFAKLPKGTIEELLKPENKKKLAFFRCQYEAIPGPGMWVGGPGSCRGSGSFRRIRRHGCDSADGRHAQTCTAEIQGKAEISGLTLLPWWSLVSPPWAALAPRCRRHADWAAAGRAQKAGGGCPMRFA